ncbi:MAG: hypothetical protein ACXADA_09455 [Candidatus Hodarchaeales archaeon]
MSLSDVINEIAIFFQQRGFKCNFNSEGADIVAVKGGFRKKKYYVVIGANVFDAGLALYRLRDVNANKILFLQEGNAKDVKVSDSKLQIVKEVEKINIDV